MLKGQNTKLNSSGKVSCLLLLFLTFLMINPATTSANALEADEVSDNNTSYDDQISAQADSGVTISFTPSSGSASLTPTTSDGASAKINVSANVKIASTGGYTIYLGGKNAALTGEKTGQTISAMSGSRTFANLDTNTWGYAVAEGSSVSDSATYSALPQGQGVSLESKSGNQSNIDKTYAISFATKIGNDKPADVYSNQVTLSVTSSPLEVVANDFGVTTMQQMTPSVCANATDINADGQISAQLEDIRDGKYYWVSRLADGKCWMTQNLNLELTTEGLSANDTDIISDWNSKSTYPPTRTKTGTITFDTTAAGTSSWKNGDTVLSAPVSPVVANFISIGNRRPSSEIDFFTRTTYTGLDGGICSKSANSVLSSESEGECAQYDAHYSTGAYYQWNAATAGTGTNVSTSSNATNSICPKGWRLPTSGAVNSQNDFYQLITKYGSIGSLQTPSITISPLFFLRVGLGYSNYTYVTNPGKEGYYWSSTTTATTGTIYGLAFGSNSDIQVSHTKPSSSYIPVRCIAR